MAIRHTSALAAKLVPVVAALVLLAGSLGMTPAAGAAGIFLGMDGSWRGNGSIKWYNGESEGIHCRATNEVAEDGNKLQQTLTCANPSMGEPWKIKSNLTYREAAGIVNGSWSESYNGLSGQVTGSVRGNKIEGRVSVSAQNVSVDVSVATSSGQQTVMLRVRTPEGLTEISVRLDRS